MSEFNNSEIDQMVDSRTSLIEPIVCVFRYHGVNFDLIYLYVNMEYVKLWEIKSIIDLKAI